MQDWMDEFRKDRMNDYATSNPCREQIQECDAIDAFHKKSTTLWAKIFPTKTKRFVE